MAAQTDPEQLIDDKLLLELYRYWIAKRGDRAMPARADIDPIEIRSLLPNLLLIDNLEAGEYRYRLVGTEIVRSVGRDFTGQTFEAALPNGPYKDYLIDLVNDVVESPQPLYAVGTFMAEARVERQVRRLVLPLSSDGTVVDMILAGQTVIEPPRDAAGMARPSLLPFTEKVRVRLV